MKAILILMSAIIGTTVLAREMQVRVTPVRPTVIESDLVLHPGTSQERTISGPWFRVTLDITNQKGPANVTIVDAQSECTSLDARHNSFHHFYLDVFELKRGDSKTVPDLYFENIGDISESAIYFCDLQLSGWEGSQDAPTRRWFDWQNDLFVTQ